MGRRERGERNNAVLAALILLLTIFPCQRDKIALGGPLKFILASGRVLSETENISEGEVGKSSKEQNWGLRGEFGGSVSLTLFLSERGMPRRKKAPPRRQRCRNTNEWLPPQSRTVAFPF